jgi:phosphoribosylamine--glycine ligase
MNILVIGSGGREHALVWRLSHSPLVKKIYAAPGNPGIAKFAECFPTTALPELLELAEQLQIDLTVVGPEAPLVAGIVDQFRAAGKQIFGPTAAAAQLEGSKAFSKAFMIRHGIPTARFAITATAEEARQAVASFGYPVVLKADGLAAGKGVVIARDADDVELALPSLLAGTLLVEEFLEGEEVSFIVLSDGKQALPLQPTQDHKAAFDGDTGPNTGGMGAYCDSGILKTEQTRLILNTIIEPTIAGMAAEGTPFSGFLYAGLMMTKNGPRVLEFNARLGDPETQALMHRMKSDFLPVLAAAARGNLDGESISWQASPSVCVVLAAHGYPGLVRTGDVISGIDEAEQSGAVVFHAGTRLLHDKLVTSGGRVLGVAATGSTLQEAIDAAYAATSHISFDGMLFRTDIGAKGLKAGLA